MTSSMCREVPLTCILFCFHLISGAVCVSSTSELLTTTDTHTDTHTPCLEKHVSARLQTPVHPNFWTPPFGTTIICLFLEAPTSEVGMGHWFPNSIWFWFTRSWFNSIPIWIQDFIRILCVCVSVPVCRSSHRQSLVSQSMMSDYESSFRFWVAAHRVLFGRTLEPWSGAVTDLTSRSWQL